MINLKKFTALIILITAAFWLLTPNPLYASKSQYYDFGPYYSRPEVLGFSFSSLENLPVPEIPDQLILSAATGTLPGHPFYPLEKIAENIQLTFTPDPVKKEELRLEFAHERLAEAKTLMDQGKTDAAAQALGDYSQTISSTAEALSTLTQQNNTAAQTLANKIEEVTAGQVVLTQTFSLSSPPAQAEIWASGTEASRMVLDQVADTKKLPAIPQELSADIQKLKDQGLISEEESNKLYSLKGRGAVRDELNKLAYSGQFPLAELAKLDEAIEQHYPQLQKQQLANLQVAELRVYQSRPQPSQEIQEELNKWQEDPSVSPSNDIKPYLWYNRAQDLAREVDLSNFSSPQQAEVARSYPSILENSTYTPQPTVTPAEPSPTPTTEKSDQTTSQPQTQDQKASPSSDLSTSPIPTPTINLSELSEPYLRENTGALPGDPGYFLKQFGENLSITFTFDTAQKAHIKMEQAEKRLAEARYLIDDSEKAALYESTIKAYQESLAEASRFVEELKDPKAAKNAAEKLQTQAARHEIVLEKGLLPPPAKNLGLISEIIKTTENAMDASADVLHQPAVPAALASRLGDLKAQGLILPEEVEDLTDSASRQEVREKIRKLIELGTFPPADAKKLDGAQLLTNSSDYNQLVEVRKVEELQNLRSIQSDLAQTPTLRSTATTLARQEQVLSSSFDPTFIKLEDLGGRENLVKVYEKLSSTPRPINGGQFGNEATPGAQLIVPTIRPSDAVLSTCPEGAIFKQYEGCVWADSGKSLNDYDQYKCEGPRQYFSFAAKKCVAYDETKGWNNNDAQPLCPLGYTWSWQTQSCQTSTGGILPYPSPSPEIEPKDEKEREERSKSCPEGASYKAPNGCVWDDSGKSVYDGNQYRCSGRRQYYSFEQEKCIPSPKEGEPYPKDSAPSCKEEGFYWSWADGKCVLAIEPQNQNQSGTPVISIDEIRPSFVSYGSPFYFLKEAGERVQQFTAFTPEAREQVSLSQAQERLAEAIDALKKDDKEGVKQALSTYTTMMQGLVGDLSKAQLNEAAKNQIAKRLSEEAVEHNLLLQKLSAWAPSEHETAISAATSSTILGVDKAADIAGEPPIPAEIKEKIEALPEQMISEEDKKKLLEMDSRVEARLKLGGLLTNGALTKTDTDFLNEDFDKVAPEVKIKVEELQKLEQLATATESKEKVEEKIEKNEEIVRSLQEFEKTFEVGKEIPSEIRPYVRLTRINEVAQTIRPDVVKLEDFQNRKDVILAVATLREEFKPTSEALKQIEDFRRRSPDKPLPAELARIEALSFSLGVRQQAGPCFLPTPLFPANTPCPAPGAAIPIASYYNTPGTGPTSRFIELYQPLPTPSTDKDGKPLVYGQGPQTSSPGVCPSGYHWMYDSGGWCMSDSGNYSSSYSYTPSGTGSGYTPYSPYYTAPGAPPATYGYPVGDNSLSDGCPYGYDSDGRGNCIPNSYPASSYSYSPPSYYGTAPTYYTTNPPAGTVPGSGPKPTSPGQCPDGYHWMSDSGGWCMANGNTYVPPGTPDYAAGTATTETGSYNCGSQPYDPVTKKCKDGACPGGFYWDGSKCTAGNYLPGAPGTSSGSPYYSPNLTKESCGPGYYWDGKGCIPGSGSGSTPWCWSASPPPGGWGLSCGSGSYWDSSTCSCRPTGSSSGSSSTSTYSSPSSYQYGCSPGNYWNGSKCVAGSYEGSGWSDSAARSGTWCQPPSSGCGSNSYWDYGSCSCRASSTYYGGSGPSSSNSCQGISCSGGTYLDYSSCTCRTSSYSSSSSSSGSYSSGYNTSTSTCTQRSCGSNEWFDWGTCSCRTNSSTSTYSGSGSTSTSGSTTTSGSSGSSSGSCPSGYHWMSDSGGWCMSDGGGSTSSGSTSSSTPTSTSTTTQSTPAPTSAPTTDSGSSGGSSSTPTTTTTTESSSPPPSSSESSPPPSTESAPPPSTESAPPPSGT